MENYTLKDNIPNTISINYSVYHNIASQSKLSHLSHANNTTEKREYYFGETFAVNNWMFVWWNLDLEVKTYFFSSEIKYIYNSCVMQPLQFE